MSRSHLGASAFLLWHLVAISISAVPAPDDVNSRNLPRRPESYTPPLPVAILDNLSRRLEQVEADVWAVTRPLHKATETYLAVTGLRQVWDMFYGPPTESRFLRLRYYIVAPSGATWTATELVGPAHRDDRIGLVDSFRASYQDKAYENAFAGLGSQLQLTGTDAPGQIADSLAPIAQYFARRFRDARLVPGERVLRVDVWYGGASILPPGQRPRPQQSEARRMLLERYAAGPVESRVDDSVRPAFGSVEREADIVWTLLYIDLP
jgi:hypothetical protein